MNKVPIGPVALVVSLVFSSTPALADGLQGGLNGGHVGRGPFVSRPFVPHEFARHPVVPRPFVPHPFVPHRFVSKPFAPNHFAQHPFAPRPSFHRSFIPFGVPTVLYVSPPVSYSSPSYYAPSAVYDSPVVYSQPVTTVSVAPPPSPMPGVIEYPTGRYELRGDGTTAPYTWVWIPNPPPPPPAAAPPAVAPGSPPPLDNPSPARPRQLYRWTDEQGVVYWTDNWDSIPEPHRAQAKRISSR